MPLKDVQEAILGARKSTGFIKTVFSSIAKGCELFILVKMIVTCGVDTVNTAGHYDYVID